MRKQTTRTKGQTQVTAQGMTRHTPAISQLLTFGFGRTMGALILSAGLAATGLAGVSPALAQGLSFEAVAKINDDVITRYELEQRIQFLTLLNAPFDVEEEALKGLTNDRLAAQEARRVGLKLTAEQVRTGMTEFAGRANLTAEQFIEALAQGGVAAETFRDFVANGLIWRELVRAKFGPITSVTEVEIDRAIANGNTGPVLQLAYSEIVIPVEGDAADEMSLARRVRAEILTESDFAAAARRYSKAASAGRGGAVARTPASSIPPEVVQLLISTGQGGVSKPIRLPDAVAIYQLTELTQEPPPEKAVAALEFAEYLLPNTADVQAIAADIGNRVDTCRDLFAEAQGQPEDRLTITKASENAIPREVAAQLATLDVGEYSAALTRGGWRVFLMLCERAPNGQTAINRAGIRDQLQSQELALQAEVWMEELRSEAIIELP